MALMDKLSQGLEDVEHIPVHLFTAAVYLWSIGTLTRAQVITGLGLEVSDETQLDQLASHYSGLNNPDKREFFGKLEALGVLMEEQKITPTQFKNLLGIT